VVCPEAIGGPLAAEPSPAEEAVAVLVAHAAILRCSSEDSPLTAFAAIPDPRDKRGIRHSLPSILGLCTAAVLSGCLTLTEITDWICSGSQLVLSRLGCRRDSDTARCVPPSPDTVERVLAKLGAQHLADRLGVALARRAGLGAPAAVPISGPVLLPAIAVDGKAIRGAAGPGGQIPYLLAAATHDNAVVIAERAIGPKTNELPEFAPLLRRLNQQIPLAGHVITVDAGLTARAIADFIVTELFAHYVMTIKFNQPKLYDALCRFDFEALPVAAQSRDRGHGRVEHRTIKVADAPEHIKELYPHVRQIFLIDRRTTRKVRKRKKGSRKYTTVTVTTHVAAVGITSMTAREAGPEHLAAYVRGHWGIENKIHWVRDTTFREDQSLIKTKSRPRIMATLRNVAIGLIRQAGYTRIRETIRKIKNSPHLLLAVLGLHNHPESAT
jgi:predicted transposase YbfD/YdcC